MRPSPTLSISQWIRVTLPESTKYYRSLKACPQGHYERYLSSNRCVICTRLLTIKQNNRRAAERVKKGRSRGAPKKNFPDRPKQCNCCGIVKSPENYYIVRSSGMLATDCKECRRYLRKGISRESLGKPLNSVIR